MVEEQKVTNTEKVKAQKRACYLRHKERYNEANRRWAMENPARVIANRKAYQEKNKEQIAAYKKEWAEINKSRVAARKKAWSDANKERAAAQQKKWREANPERRTEAHIRRRAAKQAGQSTFSEETKTKVKLLAKERRALRKEGKIFHIDHIVPLKATAFGLHVACGLHTDANLQLLPEKENLEKGNRWWPDMGDYTLEHIAELRALQELI